MGENAKRQDGGNRTLSILILKSIKLCFIIIFVNLKVVGKYDDGCEEYTLVLKLRIYLFISFTQHIDIFWQVS